MLGKRAALYGSRAVASRCSGIVSKAATSSHAVSYTTKTVPALKPFQGFRAPSWSVREYFLSGDKAKAAAEISSQEIKRLAKLSFLEPTEEQIEKLKVDVANILACVDAMQRVDVTNVQPLVSVLENNSLKRREDVVPQGIYVEERAKVILSNAQVKGGMYFAVPKQKNTFEDEF